jgi:hypothetical protein
MSPPEQGEQGEQGELASKELANRLRSGRDSP